MNHGVRARHRLTTVGCVLLSWILCGVNKPRGFGEEPASEPSVQEIRSLLETIDPYLPRMEITAEVDVFGSTTMDSLAHGWSAGFQKFHPKAKVVVSAEGSETVFERLAKSRSSVGMLSRYVTPEELKASGLRHPVAIMVSHEALGVFVHESNPLQSISFSQLVTLVCGDESGKPVTWKSVGVTGPMADQPVHVIGRNNGSGSHKFIKQYLFRTRKLLAVTEKFSSNAKVVHAVEEDPLAIAICGLKCGSHKARALHLREADQEVPDDDHAILIGEYPLTRPLTLVIDAGASDEQAAAGREFVRYALSQAGQMQTILAGFFPLDPPTLRSELLKLDEGQRSGTPNDETQRVSSKTTSEPRN
jgi:phosphate transport system substrate-binding protein